MSARRLIRDEAGFTLVEALVAAIVVAIGILGTAAVMTSADTTSLDAELQQIATNQGEKALEQMRGLDYSELGHTSTPVLPSGEPGLSGNSYQSPDSPTSEQLVSAANAESADTKYAADCVTEDSGGSSTSCFKITPALQSKAFTVAQADGRTVTGHIYTLVTWHDEECESLPIASIKNLLGSGGTSESLYNLLEARKAALSALRTQLGTLYALLPSAAKALYDTTIPALINSSDGLITQVENQLNTLGTKLDSLTTLDLCDLNLDAAQALFSILDTNPSTGTLEVKGAISSPFSASADLAVQTASVASALDALGGLSCVLLPGSSLCTALSSASNTLKSTITNGTTVDLTDLKGKLSTLDTALDGTANTTHNSKRVTVAVTIDKARGDITPQNVTYLSTIVTNPDDGLVIK